MNKRKLTALLLALMLILCGCQGGRQNAAIPEDTTVEKSDNSFGARYSFNMKSIDKKLSEALADYSADYDKVQWQTLSSGLIDDNGVAYTSCCKTQKGITYTAAVEDNSKKVMNLGCGCATKRLDTVLYRERFLKLNAAIAQCAGGYTESDRVFLMKLFDDLLSGDEDTLVYRDMLYIKSVDEETTVLMTAPCSDIVIRKNDYREYEFN